MVIIPKQLASPVISILLSCPFSMIVPTTSSENLVCLGVCLTVREVYFSLYTCTSLAGNQSSFRGWSRLAFAPPNSSPTKDHIYEAPNHVCLTFGLRLCISFRPGSLGSVPVQHKRNSRWLPVTDRIFSGRKISLAMSKSSICIVKVVSAMNRYV